MLTHREKLLSCDICGEKFNFKTKLVRHIHVHFGIKRDHGNSAKERIVCHQCSDLVPKNNIARHIRMRHEKYRPFKCEFLDCGSAFSESRHLNEHMNIHMGLRPFVCEFCSLGKKSELLHFKIKNDYLFKGFHHLSALRSHRLRYKTFLISSFILRK